MSVQPDGNPPLPPLPPGTQRDAENVLAGHFHAHRERFTRDALSSAARQAGYSPEAVDVAWRMADRDQPGPGRVDSARFAGLARLVLLLMYVGTFLALVVPTRMAEATYGLGPLILGALLFVAFLIGLHLVGRRRVVPANAALALATMLAVPFVLLVIVAGLCVWTTGPVLLGEPV